MPLRAETVPGENVVERRKIEDIHIACRQRLAMKTGGGGSTDGVLLQAPFADELFESVTDGLHDFLMSSS